MELVPILSTIILVGTIATFLLAVFAYIMYKWRERHVHEVDRAHPTTELEPHVLVAPQQPVPEVRQQSAGSPPRVEREAERPYQPRTRDSLFWEYTDEGFVPVRPRTKSGSEESGSTGAAPNGGTAWM